MATIADLGVVLTVSTVNYIMPIYNAIEANQELQSSIEENTGALSRMEGAAKSAGSTLATALGVASATGALGFGVKLASDAEQAEIALTTMLGSAQSAKNLMGQLTQTAAQTPFELPELTKATTSLIAFGESQYQVLGTLRRIGDIASGVGAPLGELATVYGKARVQGRLFAEDVNQLTGRGIPVIQEFAKQFGVTETAVKDLVKEGKVSFANLEQAFVSLTSQGGKFSGLMAAQSQSIAGLWSTLKDSVGANLRGMGQSFLKAADAAGLIKALTVSLDGLATASKFVGAVLGTMAGMVASVVQYLSTWTKTVATAYVLLKAFALAWTVLKVAMLSAIAAKVLWWATAKLGLWLGMTKAVMLFKFAIFALVAPFKAAAIAATWFHAIAGPAGWIKLAASIAVAGAAAYAVKKAFDSIEGAGGKGGGFTPLQDDALDPAALERYNTEMQTLNERLKAGEILAGQWTTAVNVAKQVLAKDDAMAKQALAATQAFEDSAKALEKLAKVGEKINQEFRELGMDEQAKKMLELRDAIEEVNNARTGNVTLTEAAMIQEKQQAMIQESQHQLATIANFEKQKKISEAIATIRQRAAQAGMTDAQKAADNMRRAGGDASQQAAVRALYEEADAREELAKKAKAADDKMRQSALSLMKDARTPAEEYLQTIADLNKMLSTVDATTGKTFINQAQFMAGLANASKDLRKSFGTASTEGPEGNLRGSAGAFKAINRFERQSSPQEKVESLLEVGNRQRERVAKAAEEELRELRDMKLVDF